MSEEKREHWDLLKWASSLTERQANVASFILVFGWFFTAIAAPVLGGLLFASVGAVSLVLTVRELWRARESLKWPVVEAQILATRVDEQRGRRRHYVPVVRYRYMCVDTVYEGDRIIFSGQSVSTGSLDEATQFMAQFEVGMRIPIRVCPTNPKLSVIEPGFDPRWWVPLVVALMFIIGGLSIATHPRRTS